MFIGVYKNITQRLAIALVALFDLEIKQMDVIRAFLNLIANRDIYVKVPPDQEVNRETLKDTLGQVCELLKALYSLKQAPRLQQKELASVLQQLEFKAYTSN